MRFPRLLVTGTLTVLIATGCGSASHHRGATGPAGPSGPAGRFPIVVAHPKVESIELASAERRQLRGDRALLLAPSKLAFMTTGGVSCAWWPARLTVLRPSAIRIDMRVNGDVSSCGSGAVGFPIAVKIDPRIIDVRRPVTVRLAYKVRLRESTNHWNKTVVAPALSRS